MHIHGAFTRRRAATASVTVALLLASCSSASDQTVRTPVAVQVTVNEFEIIATPAEFEAGETYTFTVTNEGAAEHEFMITEPMAHAGMDMGEMDEMALAVIPVEQLPPGATASVTVTMPDNASLEMACHIEGHYEQGMRRPIELS